MQNELDLQRNVSQAFDSNRQAAKAEINKNRDDLEQQRKAGTITEAEYQDKAKNLDNLALLLDTVSAGLYTPSNSVGGSLTAAASPAMTQKIGEIFKPSGAMAQYEGTALHGAAQGIWAAAVAYAGGNDPLSAGVSAGVSEVAVPVLGNWLFPGKDKADYTAEEKQTLSAIAGVLSAGGTLAAGGSATDAAAANGAAMNAVENNYYVTPEAAKNGQPKALHTFSVLKEQIHRECSTNGRIQECRNHIEKIIQFVSNKHYSALYREQQREALIYLSQNPELVASYLKNEHEKLSNLDKSLLTRYILPGTQIVSGGLGIVLLTAAGVTTCAETFGLGCLSALTGGGEFT